MPLYRYVKKEKSSLHHFLYKNRKKIAKVVPVSLSILGGFLLLASVGQIAIWQWKYSVGLEKTQIVKPVPDISKVEAKEQDSDLTKASNWFPNSHQKNPSGLKASSYKISIPKLKIKDALVVIGSEDLDKSVIHYGGTALPGEFGTGVIFGHSVLPQFFNPTNYKTIFSTLPTLKEGDEVLVNYDGVLYKYVVIGMRVVDPADITVLEQKYDDSYLGIVTCVPPGTYWKRLFVLTKIVNIHS
jgi:sortase A